MIILVLSIYTCSLIYRIQNIFIYKYGYITLDIYTVKSLNPIEIH